MTKYSFLFGVIVFLYSCRFPNKDNEQIRKCFANYKTAILNRKGELGLKCVDSKTINFYSVTLQKVIELDSAQLEKEASIDKYTILKIRQNIPYDSILKMNAKDLLVSLINHGMAGNVNISQYDIGKIQIDNDTASVEKIINGKATEFVFKFYKEKDGWKLSIFSPREHELYNWGIKQSILKSRISEDEYILNYVETTSVSKLKKDIWHPLSIKK